jgi:hypothetical protein
MSARAQEPSQAALVAARELFREATQDADALRFDVALEKFKRVAATKETGPVRFNIAKCEHALGKIGAALADYELAEREALQEKKADIAKLAQKQANLLRPKVPRVTISVTPAPKDLSVTLDGEKLPSASLGIALPVDPGPHHVEAFAPGYATAKREVQLKEAEQQRVALELTAESGGAAPVAHPDDAPEVKLALEQPPPQVTPVAKDQPPPEETSSGSARRTWGFVVLGAGAAMAVTSVVFWRVHESKVSDIDALNARCRSSGTCGPADTRQGQDLQDKSNSSQTLGTVFAIGAGAAVVAGAVMVLWPTRKATALHVTPAFGPSVAGLSFDGSF